MGLGAIIGGGLSAVGSIVGGSKAASAQKSAADQATAAQLAMFNTTQENLKPYMELGKSAAGQMTNLAGLGEGQNPLTSALLSPISMDQATLEQTPGYQFNLAQGLKAVQNTAAARGLGVSGAAQKGAASFATGLADTTYQQQFANAVTNQTNQYNRLMGLVGTGQNAAANLGGYATQTGSNLGSNIIGAGNAQAASYMNSANAFGNFASSIPIYSMLNGMYGNRETQMSDVMTG